MSDKKACSWIEKRSVIKFLVAEECKAVEIGWRMQGLREKFFQGVRRLMPGPQN